jgi:hypothetical protein
MENFRNWILNIFLLGLGRAQAENQPKDRTRPGQGFLARPKGLTFKNFFSNSLSTILQNKHPGQQKAQARSVKPKPDPSLRYSSPTQPYFCIDKDRTGLITLKSAAGLPDFSW